MSQEFNIHQKEESEEQKKKRKIEEAQAQGRIVVDFMDPKIQNALEIAPYFEKYGENVAVEVTPEMCEKGEDGKLYFKTTNPETGALETKNAWDPVKNKGSMKVTGNKGEVYLVKESTFKSRYQVIDKEKNLYRPTGIVSAIKNPFDDIPDEKLSLWAPGWQDVINLEPGGMIVAPVYLNREGGESDMKKDVYIINPFGWEGVYREYLRNK